MQDRYTPEEVDYMFGGVNNLVGEEFRTVLARAISKLPRKIVEWSTENLLFVSSSEEYWAFSLSKREWGHVKGFVFLSEGLKNESEQRQTFSIAHEIAHHRLKHKSPIFGRLTEEEMRRQEKEANELVDKWLGS